MSGVYVALYAWRSNLQAALQLRCILHCTALHCTALHCRLVNDGVLTPQADVQVPEIPMDLATAVKLKKVREGGLAAFRYVNTGRFQARE